VVATIRRTLELYDPRTLRRVASAPAGAGPTNVAAEGNRLYVADTGGNAIRVYATDHGLALVRRIPLPGGPYALTIDPIARRLFVTLASRNELVELPTDGARGADRRFPTVRQPDAVAVDSSLGTVAVTGRDAGVLQLIRTSANAPRPTSAAQP
jgi:DNA-binding beta-propeller fold protein YncE